MGVSSGSGGGGFKLEKTWRATGVGSTTFNSSGNFTIPFGKYEILVSGRAGTGNPDTPGNLAAYNPTVPSTLAGYNPDSPSNISSYNPITPGSPTGAYNAGSGGNLAGYTQSGGNIANYNTTTSGGFNVSQTVNRYIAPQTGNAGNPTGAYNPGGGGSLAGYNTYVAGSANYNAPVAGNANYNTPVAGNANYNTPVAGNANYNSPAAGNANYNTPVTATIYRTYLCEPAGTFFDPGNSSPGPALYVDEFMYNSVYANYDIYTTPNAVFFCPTPSTNFQSVAGNISNYNPPSAGNIAAYNAPSAGNIAAYNAPSAGNIAAYNAPSAGNIAAYNAPSGGNPNYNSVTAGTENYNPANSPFAGEYTVWGPFTPSFSPTCPTPFSYFQGFYQIGGNITNFYEQNNYSCSPVPGSPGNANYNPTTNTPVFNAFVGGSENYNSATGGNAVYNAGVVGNAVYNAAGGQNANYNTPSGGVAGAATNVLGVYFPGGNAGAAAPFVPSTLINRYIADQATYPVTVPTGGFITIQSK